MEERKITESEYKEALIETKKIYEEKRNLLFQMEMTKFDKEMQKILSEKKKELDKKYAKNRVLIRTYELENDIEIERGKKL